jgi:hydrogenase expression/formation protein HypE
MTVTLTTAPRDRVIVASEEVVLLKHGAGGRAMRRLIEETLAVGFLETPNAAQGSVGLAAFDDGAAIRVGDQWLVITTDSHVVQPAFFPGGDIGRLAVSGTVNDLAMMGATEPLALTSAIIVEEGYRFSDLERIQRSMQQACREAGVSIVTGDTKVMGRGELDGIAITTTGVALADCIVRDSGLQPGDQIIVTGTIGDHGIALMAARHGLVFDHELQSDVAPINGLIRAALATGRNAISAMKDPTRGGVASSLHEMAAKGRVGIVIHESRLPIVGEVRAAAEMLGLDPLHIANEGKAVIGVRGGDSAATAVLDALHAHPLGINAAIVGECIADHPGRVILDTGMGRRLIAEIEGAPLPRIC